MPVAIPTRITILAVVAVLAIGALLLLAWFSSPWVRFVFSQGDVGECRVVFSQTHTNIDVGQTVEYQWTYENADPAQLRIVAPDTAVATLGSNTQTTASITGVARGVSELTVSMYCLNEKQKGQWIANAAPVVVGGADGSGLDSWPPTEDASGEQGVNVPDLEVMNATVIPNEVTPGAAVRVGAETHNEGLAPSSVTKLRFYRSTNAFISTLDTQLEVYDIPIISQGSHWSSVHSFNAPTTAGTYYYGACVDTFADELDDTNNCSLATTLTVRPFAFTPDPIRLGRNSNIWRVPAHVSRFYLDVDYATDDSKDRVGNINVQRLNSGGTVLESYEVDHENDSGALPATFTANARVRINVDKDAFDSHASAVTLTFHNGTGTSSPAVAVAKVKKEQRPFRPTNVSATVDHTGTGTVTFTWSKGADRPHDNPHHYELVIPDPANVGTFLYTDRNISDSSDPTTYTISNARSHGLEGIHIAQIAHCNSVGGCSLTYGISFTLNALPATPEPGTPTPLPVPETPSNIRLTQDISLGNSSVLRIAWDQLPGAANYQVRYSDDEVDWEESGELTSGTTTYPATGLTSGETYVFQVQAKGDGTNLQGVWGSWSANHEFSVPTIELSDLVSSLQVNETDDFKVVVEELNEERDYALSAHANNKAGLGTQGGQSDCSVTVLRTDLADNTEEHTWNLQVKGCAEGTARVTGLLRDRTGRSQQSTYREVGRVSADFTVGPQATPTPSPTPTATPGPKPPAPTALSLSVDPSVSGRLVFKYQPSLWAISSDHRYILELQVEGSSTVVQSKRATVSDATEKTGHFTGIALGKKYRARAQRCSDATFNSCGDWSSWVVIPPPPTGISLSRHATDPLQMSFSYTATAWTGVAGKTKTHQIELALQNPDGTWTVKLTATSGMSPRALVRLTPGGTYRARARQCGDSTNDFCGYWTDWSNTESLLQLNTPTITDVEPGHLRHAKLSWTPVSGSIGYNILAHKGNTSSYILDTAGKPLLLRAPEYSIPLDNYFHDDDYDKFQVKAVPTAGTNVHESELSAAVGVVPSPIKRINGKTTTGDPGQAKVDWQGTSNGSKFVVRHRPLGGDNDEQNWSGYDDYGAWGKSNELATGTVSHTIGRLTLKTIYAVQLYWEEAGIKVYSGSYDYVWPNDGFPARNITAGDQGRVASYPYFGHWPDRTYNYSICADTFDRSEWTPLLQQAFQTWQDATDGLVTMTNTGNTCTVGTLVRLPIFVLMTNMAETNLNVNEVYMVRDAQWSAFQKLNFGAFIDDPQGYCGLVTPSACVISRAYGTSQSASTRLSNARGSKNAVDILFSESELKNTSLARPSSTTYQRCEGSADDPSTFAYRTAIHEAGHALGTSGLFFLSGSIVLGDVIEALLDDESAVLALLASIQSADPLYHGAHPAIPGSVMNYDEVTTDAMGEPDCFPHPFDVMAMYALYQTVD